MKRVVLFLSVFSSSLAWAEVKGSRFFIGTSAFMLANLDQGEEDPPHFYQLNLGYQLTPTDVLSIELITWRYYAPLGISSGGSASREEDKFPGYVSAEGMALAYQKFIWGNFYTALHSAWFDQTYFDRDSVEIGCGHQLFLTLRLGYHLSFLSDRVFLEPSLAVTHWPINTGLPQEFQEKEDQWRKYQFEPGFHMGFVF